MEKRWIEAACRGDRKARGILLRELQDSWYRLCLGMLGDSELAREAVQETALRFLSRLAGYRGESTLMTWSMGIAINVIREMRRRKRMLSDDGALANATPASESGPVALALASEERSVLRAMLTQLPQRQREAVMLRFFEDLSVEETAQAMDCAAGTVKATIHQALRALRRRIEQVS